MFEIIKYSLLVHFDPVQSTICNTPNPKVALTVGKEPAYRITGEGIFDIGLLLNFSENIRKPVCPANTMIPRYDP